MVKQLTLTLKEYELLDLFWRNEAVYAGTREARAKLEQGFRRLFRSGKGNMIRLQDALELVHIDFIILLDKNGSIKQWKEAPPYMVVFQREPIK